jgi:hypothetical protein
MVITTAYDILQEVFQVDAVYGVREAIVKAIAISTTQAGTSITYSIAYSKATNGSANVLENTLYDDVDLALAAYRTLVLVP